MDVRSIVKDWLETHGYGGLYESDFECGCELDDLMPCDNPLQECCAGYKHPGKHGFDFLICPTKQSGDKGEGA